MLTQRFSLKHERAEMLSAKPAYLEPIRILIEIHCRNL
jgi:hypothetical protein